MAKYRKKALTVTVERAERQQYITTLEGVSEAKRGDYILTGVDNEQWVVKPKWFHQAYTHIEGNKYRRNPQVLEAEQIHESQIVHAPTGDIKGDKGDYKVTGKTGEQWFVKPDIFKKTYERVEKSMTMTALQQVINQIGEDTVRKSIPVGYKIGRCDLHGSYLISPYSEELCPICPINRQPANGPTASDVSHYITINEELDPTTGTNPQQKSNPLALP